MADETAAPAAPAEPSTAPAVEPVTTPPVTGETPVAAETTPEAPETPEEGTEDDKPKRLPRSQRDKRKISYLAGENARMAEELTQLRQSQPAKADAEPKLEDFADYDKFSDAKTRWIARQEAATAREEFRKELVSEREKNFAQSKVKELEARAEALKERVPDFDKVIKTFVEDGGEFAPHVRDAVIRVGPELAYYLATHPDIAEELNELEPFEAAIRIGELRPKLSPAQPKKQTQAPAPVAAPKGGAAAPVDLRALAKSDDVSAYVAARRAQQKARE